MNTTGKTSKPLLSKSTFVRGCKCLKALHLHKYHYNLKDEISKSKQAIFDQGHEVGQYARQLFPSGIDCTVHPAYDYPASIRKTAEVLAYRGTTLYEPGFIYNNVFAAVDILEVKKNGWHIYEVKSSTEVKEYHFLDAAIQYYILKGLKLPVTQVHVVTINSEYVRKGNIDPEQLFTIHNVTQQVQDLQAYIEDQLPMMFNILASPQMPNVDIGRQCSQYYDCDFKGHCWKRFDNVEFPVYTIKRLDEYKLWQLVRKNILCQSQVPNFFPLSDHQKIQVHANKRQASPKPNLPNIRAFLRTIEAPIAFLDFETFSSAIPLFDEVRPYQQVPFQYSVHVMQRDGKLVHDDFLGDGKTDPRRALVEKLIRVLKDAKTILCYYISFEKSRLRELQLLFPEYHTQLQDIIDKLADLIIPFRSKDVYHYKMNGSASLKSVLPALLPHPTYDHLEIQEGSSAPQAYLDLFLEHDNSAIKRLRAALLEYCKLDTYAMVELYRYLQSLSPLKVAVNNLRQEDNDATISISLTDKKLVKV
jgi:hypothetical protein